MFINKINSVVNVGFKGYQHEKNNVGENVMRFNYVYDYDKEDCEVQFFKLTKDSNYNYTVKENPIASVKLNPEGVDVNLQKLTGLDKDEAFVYKIVRKDKSTGKVIWEGADTGNKIYGGKYSFVSRKGTTPMVQGAAYLAIPDSFKSGAMYRSFNENNTGDIYYDKNIQKNAEGQIRHFSNLFGGSIAGLHAGIPYLKENGYKILFTTPIANGDSIASHGYWNKNNMQLASRMGTTENFSSFMKDLYKNGMKYVYDGTFTSEGLEGIHFQYALKWAEHNPQSYYWFRMTGMKNSSLGLGVIPKNDEYLRHRLVNAPYQYELQSNGTYKEIPNPNYNNKKPTFVQIYDSRLVSDELLKDDTKPFARYDKQLDDEIGINSHEDTVINYTFPIRDFKEYQNRIKVINDLNKNQGKNIKLDSAEGAKLAVHFSNFKIDKKTEGGFVTWDANTDMVKMNYHISGYDEKLLQAIPEKSMRDYEKKMIERGSFEVQDMTIQAGKYWSQSVKDIQTLYSAKTIGSAKTISAINKLIEEGKLPQEAKINEEILNNVLNGYYLLAPKGILDKNSVTVKALMQMPLDAIELNDNTLGVLSTSYFSNRATNEETLGVSRFDLMKQENPHLVEPYSNVYNKVNSLFNNEIKAFADDIIKKVNETSNEKLIDSDGEYTEYGEYVMELIGKDITKYAILKSLAGDSFKTKILKSGEITYDYDNIKENTSLEALGIQANNPQEEAQMLEKKIRKGLKTLSSSDVNYVASSISKRIEGTDTSSFRLAEAMVNKAGLGLDWRLDAAKDVMDQDAVRNEDNTFDDINDEVIKFWAKWVQGVKSVNPNSYLVAEITDIEDLMKDTYGLKSNPWGETNIGQKFSSVQDFMAKLYSETGITSEAGYSYFFTDLLKVFSPEFESGTGVSPEHDSFKARFDDLIQNRSIDYIKNLYSFIGNHDKPRTLHGLSLDMRLFHSKILNDCKKFSEEHDQRMDVIRVLSGAKTMAEVPIELRLNVDNNDYFKTVSGRSVAMSKLLMDSVYEDLGNLASEADKKLIIDALVDLANGNYLGVGSTNKMTKIRINELTNLENAFGEILKMAENHGLKLTIAEKNELIGNVVAKANSMDLDEYLVHGDFDWTALNSDIKIKNANYARDILGDSFDSSKHSLYTVQLARLLKNAYIETGNFANEKDAIFAGLKDFAQKYDRKTINSNRDEFKTDESFKDSMRKNGYGARDIRTAMIMAVKQAEFKSGKTIANKEEIIDTVFKSATEPGVTKLAMIMEFLKALSGNAAMYAGDEFGMSGYDEKAKNIYLQNRNALPWEQLSEQSMLGDYRKNVMNVINGTLQDRSNPELHSLNDGTPYSLNVVVNSKDRQDIYDRIDAINKELKTATGEQKDNLEKECRELSRELAKIAYLMHSANGDMTISVFDAGSINHSNRFDYFKEYGLDTEEKRRQFFKDNEIESINPNNRYVPIQPKSEMDMIMLGAGITLPVGMVFMNSNARDKATYVIKDIGGKLALVKEGGKKIVMDGSTSKNGVMILKCIKNIVFKGSSKNRTFYNAQYNFVSNPYKMSEKPEEGKKLSIIAK